MKSLILAFLTLLFLTLTWGCAQDDNAVPVLTEKFTGEWSGSFSGTEKGSWTAVMEPTGVLSGTIQSENSTNTYTLKGMVTADGSLKATYALSGQTIGSFKGELTKSIGSGIWKSADEVSEGIWIGNKKDNNK